MTAALAYGVDPERVDEGTHNIFVRSRAFRRPTFPRYGLIDHKVFDRALRAEYRDVVIEDLWRPFFAVSSNLSNNKPRIHRSRAGVARGACLGLDTWPCCRRSSPPTARCWWTAGSWTTSRSRR